MAAKVDEVSLAEAGLLSHSLSQGNAPDNFSEVVPGLYRSAYPEESNFGYLKALKLKTIVTLVDKEVPEGYRNFLAKNDINHCVFDMSGTKKEKIPDALMVSILEVITDRNNYPLMVHCNHGKHRTGCVIAMFQQIVGHSALGAWDKAYTVRQYEKFAQPKIRPTDIEYITNTDPRVLFPQHVLENARAIGDSLLPPASAFWGNWSKNHSTTKSRKVSLRLILGLLVLVCVACNYSVYRSQPSESTGDSVFKALWSSWTGSTQKSPVSPDYPCSSQSSRPSTDDGGL